jgi:ATP-dependent protease ClpP protease subunit
MLIYCKSGPEGAEMLIYDDIGDFGGGQGVSPAAVSSFLSEHRKDPVTIRINSFGGLAYDGLVMHHAIKDHPQTTVKVEGIAFSAAAFVAMAGKRIIIQPAAQIGIHQASGVAAGNVDTMRDVIRWLEQMDASQVDIFSSRTGQPRSKVQAWLKGKDGQDGTLFSATEAVKFGFADQIHGEAKQGTKSQFSRLTAIARRQMRKYA